MSNGIKLSPKYGLNPTIPVCAWCGETKNEIALCGHIGDGRKHEDFEAPKHCVLDYEPCDKCKEQWSKGVVCIEVRTSPCSEGQPPIQKGAYPTGRVVVVKKEVAEKTFSPEYCKAGRLLMEEKVFNSVFEGLIK